MAAIDPSAKPIDANAPKRATLKIIRRPLDLDDYEEEDDEEEDGEGQGDDEEELSRLRQTSKKLMEASNSIKKALKAAEQNAMEVDGKGDGSGDDEESDMGGFETEEFVICTLDTERVRTTGSSDLSICIDADWLLDLPAASRHRHRRG